MVCCLLFFPEMLSDRFRFPPWIAIAWNTLQSKFCERWAKSSNLSGCSYECVMTRPSNSRQLILVSSSTTKLHSSLLGPICALKCQMDHLSSCSFPCSQISTETKSSQYLEFSVGTCFICTYHERDSIKTKQIQRRLKQQSLQMEWLHFLRVLAWTISSRLTYVRVFNEGLHKPYFFMNIQSIIQTNAINSNFCSLGSVGKFGYFFFVNKEFQYYSGPYFTLLLNL